MTEIADRYRRLAAGFTVRVDAVAPDAWDRPAPCAGWVARDVVEHLLEWVPSFFESRSTVRLPSTDWHALDDAIQRALDDPATAAAPVDTPMGEGTFESAIETFVLLDVLVHTWDLARAAGLDETIDAVECRRFLDAMAPVDDAIRGEHFGPRVEVAADADDQTKLLAFTGRTP